MKRRILPPSGLPGRKQPKVEPEQEIPHSGFERGGETRVTLCTQKQVIIQVLDQGLTGRKVGIIIISLEQLQSCYFSFVECRWVQLCCANWNAQVSPSTAHWGRDHRPRSKSLPIAEHQKNNCLICFASINLYHIVYPVLPHSRARFFALPWDSP